MEVDLAGSVAVVAGAGGPLADACRSALAANGATVVTAAQAGEIAEIRARASRLDILVHFAAGSDAATTEALCRSAGGAMARGGRMVNVDSARGLIPVRGEGAASASAAAVFALTRSLALEFGTSGIRINALAVGPAQPGDERLLSHTPLGRAADPEEVASALLFLVDPENSYTTGHVLAVDGGWTAGFARNF
ncbi:MAG TPA: SDR family oxidoreductase [Bauldia sp.]|nr:SDR family oxidoreductase [Bauldia sp.]